MPLESFFDRKFKSIIAYLAKNQKLIDSNAEYKESILQRVRHWIMLANFVCSENETLDAIQDKLNELDMEGIVHFYSKKLKHKVSILPDGVEKPTPQKGILTLTKSETISLKEIAEMFDAEIEDIE